MSSPCPVPGCTGHQQTGRLMCLRHWRMVSDATQKEVYRTWRAFLKASAAADKARGSYPREDVFAALKTYRTARDQAIGEAGREEALHSGKPDPLDRLAKAAEGLMP